MKIRFVKIWCGSYGIFEAGRLVDISGPMLTACPPDVYQKVELVRFLQDCEWGDNIFPKGSVAEMVWPMHLNIPKDAYETISIEAAGTAKIIIPAEPLGTAKKNKQAGRPKDDSKKGKSKKAG